MTFLYRQRNFYSILITDRVFFIGLRLLASLGTKPNTPELLTEIVCQLLIISAIKDLAIPLMRYTYVSIPAPTTQIPAMLSIQIYGWLDWIFLHWQCERVMSLGSMRVSLKIVMYLIVRDVRGVSGVALNCWFPLMPASLSDGCTPDRCRFLSGTGWEFRNSISFKADMTGDRQKLPVSSVRAIVDVIVFSRQLESSSLGEYVLLWAR